MDEFGFDDDDEFLNLGLEEDNCLRSKSIVTEQTDVIQNENKHRSDKTVAVDHNGVNFGESSSNNVSMETDEDSNIFASSSPSYSPRESDSGDFEKSNYFDNPSKNYNCANDENESVQNVLVADIEAKKSRNSTPISNFAVDFDGFDDADDELFSQIEIIEQKIINSKSAVSSTPASHQQRKYTDFGQNNASRECFNQSETGYSPGYILDRKRSPKNDTNTLMGPPTNPVLKRRNLSSISNKIVDKANDQTTGSQSHQTKVSRKDTDSEAFERFTGQSPDTVYHLKRRFPGPAGLLPKIHPNELKLLNHSPHPLSQRFSKIIAEDAEVADKEVAVLQGIIPGLESRSENEQLCLRKAPWKEMLEELKMDLNDSNCPINYMNIRWIRTKALKVSVFLKIPFLVAVLLEAPGIFVGKNSSSKDRLSNPSVKLIDSTGSIVAAVDAKLVSLFGYALTPGAAIALKNVGLLRFKRQVLLTITRQNLICITSLISESGTSPQDSYLMAGTQSPKVINDENVPLVSSSSVNNVNILKFSEFSPSTVMKAYEELASLKANSLEEVYGCQDEKCDTSASANLFSKIGSVQHFNREMSRLPDDTNVVANQPICNDNSDVDMSVFDDDDDELFQALDNIDFGNEDIF